MTSHPLGRRPPTRFSFRDVLRRRHLQEAPVGVTDDPNNPRLHHGVDDAPIGGQHDTYLVLSERERQAGFVRQLRTSYRHVGPPGPNGDLRDLTDDEAERHRDRTPPYVKFEPNDDPDSPIVGRFWTQEQLDAIDKGCRQVTTMGTALAETYARDPRFYGAEDKPVLMLAPGLAREWGNTLLEAADAADRDLAAYLAGYQPHDHEARR